MKMLFLSGAAAIALTAGSPSAAIGSDNGAAATAPTVHRYGTWGVDIDARDTSVRPGDDFQRYASGKWLDANEIPADKSSNGIGSELVDRTQDQLRAIVMGAPRETQLGAFYASYMDEARLEQLDMAPLKTELDAIAAIRTKQEFTRRMGRSNSDFGGTLFGLGVYADPTLPINSLWMVQSGMGLPDRDYYLLDKYKPQRDAYRAYVERTLRLIGHADPAAGAGQVLAFETELAKVAWPQVDRRDFTKLNNPMSPAQLAAYAPGVDWGAYLAASGVSENRLLASENTAIKATAAIYARTPLPLLKTWQQFKVADQASNYLSKRFVDSKFQFTKTLNGAKELRPRWRRGILDVDGRLGELLGKTYVDRHFSPRSKAMMETLVDNLKKAAAVRIKGNSWMSAPTKQAALAKLGNMQVMVGYPEKFRDYSALQLRTDDLFGNVQRSNAFEWAYQLSELGKPVDKKKWGMSPATVDAYNNFLENKIVFPAGILQPPFFDPDADPVVNYGAIGAIIGHEIMHGFDDQGRKFDENGRLRDWWTAGDAKRFKALTAELSRQYSSYEAAPGVFINGDFTMGENIGDMSGLQVAHDAYLMSLGGKPAPVVDGLTGDQRFFLAFAQAWRGKQRDDAIKTQVASDPHSPRRFRIIGPLRNLDAWYEAFGVQPGSKFYIPPEKRVRIW